MDTISFYNNHIPARDANTPFSIWLKTYDNDIRNIFHMMTQELPEIIVNDKNYLKTATTIYNLSSKAV
jgi:hypothetical protein